MKKIAPIITSLFFIFLTSFSFGQGGWNTLTTTYTGNFKDIFFVSNDTGYAVGGNNTNGTIYKTTNGGSTWSSTAITGASFESVWFEGSNTGWAAGLTGKIYKTNNAGSTWVALTSGTTTNLNCVKFLSGQSLTGYAVGGSIFLKTINGGTSWASSTITIPGVTSIDFQSVALTSASNGIVCGSYNFINGFIIMTTNGGASWSPVPFTTTAKLNDLSFPSTLIGYAVGNAGGIYKSTNGGSSWVAQVSGVTNNLNGVHFVSTTQGFAVGDGGVILATSDGGSTWVSQTSGVTTDLQNSHAFNASAVYIASDNNKILKSTTGGYSLMVSVADDNVYCNGYSNLHAITNYNGSGTLTYTWNASPYLSSTTDSIVTAGPLSVNESFIVTVTDGSITHSDTCMITVMPLETDSLCIVAVDSATDYPVIVFEKHISGPIEYYNIYRESNVAGIYDSIGYIHPDSAGVFIDSASNVQTRQYSYKISNVDSCGNESIMSSAHKTLHLQVSAGSGGVWNLLWTPYEGIAVQSYEIWRGADTINMALIGTVPGSNVSYTDLNPPAGGLYYFVRIISAYVCQPYNYKAKTNYNSSRSNHANNGIINQTLHANFSGTPVSGIEPLNVQFSDISNGFPTQWLWNFGDGNTSTSQSPSHIYTTAGKFTVKLFVSNSTVSDSMTKVDYITVGGIGFNDLNLDLDLKIYPNPASSGSSIYIDYEHVKINKVIMIDIVGKSIPIKTLRSNNRIEIKTNELPSGIYVLKLTSSEGDALMRKIIIE